mmetsp:Transcript_26989/g.32700  ORF Transcript_26989/g.32700 Transcript_26989/m.32700 type:complete len:136 (-) Transcript_26989:1021-1428(-)
MSLARGPVNSYFIRSRMKNKYLPYFVKAEEPYLNKRGSKSQQDCDKNVLALNPTLGAHVVKIRILQDKIADGYKNRLALWNNVRKIGYNATQNKVFVRQGVKILMQHNEGKPWQKYKAPGKYKNIVVGTCVEMVW